MSVRTYITDEKCPHCDRNILEEITAHVYQEGGKDFQFQCPRCENMLDIEINPVPSFSIAKVEAAQHRVHSDAGDSAVSTSIVHASAESTSQAEPTPTQRG